MIDYEKLWLRFMATIGLKGTSSPMSKQTRDEIVAKMAEMEKEAKENESYNLVVNLSRDDIVAAVGRENAEKITDEQMCEIAIQLNNRLLLKGNNYYGELRATLKDFLDTN